MISVILFYSSYIALIFLGVFRAPVYLVCLYQIVYFLNPMARWWASLIPDLSYSYYASITLLFFTIINWSKSKNKLNEAVSIKYLISFGLLYYLIYFVAVDKVTHLEYSNYLIKAIIISVCFFKLLDTVEKLKKSVYAYILGCGYIGYYVYQVGRNAGDRVNGVGLVDAPTTNTAAAALVPSIAIMFCLFLQEKILYRKLGIGILLALTANSLVLMNSRGAFLGVAASMLYYTFFHTKYYDDFSKKFKALGFISILGVSGLFVIVDQGFIDRMMTLKEMNTEVNYEQESGNTRIEFWKATVRMSKDYPLGMGFRGFVIYSPLYLPTALDTGKSRNRAIHSTWFEVLNETGYIGLLIFLAMIFKTNKLFTEVKSQLNQKGQEFNYLLVLSMHSGFIGFLITASFVNRLRAEVLILFVTYAAICKLVFWKNNEK